MNKNIKERTLSLLMLGLLLTIYSCNKEEIEVFTSDDSGVYFQYVSSWVYGTGIENYSDSITYSFASASPTSKGVVLAVTARSLGKVEDFDRPVKVVINSDETTAVEGVHYEVDLDTIMIRAGESSVRVPIRFLRTPELLKGMVRVSIELEENEHFNLYIKEYKNTNAYGAKGSTLSSTKFSFIVSEQYTQPFYWRLFGNSYFGPWTPNKYVYVNEVLDLTVRDWTNAGQSGAKIAGGRFSFFAIALRRDLQERADSGNPMYDADGSFMQLAPAYQVDYSAYELLK